MTITDVNGNTIRTGRQARAWYNANRDRATEIDRDGYGRVMVTFVGGNIAWWFHIDERVRIPERLVTA